MVEVDDEATKFIQHQKYGDDVTNREAFTEGWHKGQQALMKKFRKELSIGADGTSLKCTCGRLNCHELHLCSGDLVFVLSYVHRADMSKLLQEDGKC